MGVRDVGLKVKLIIFIYLIWSISTGESTSKDLVAYLLLYLVTIFSNGIIKKKYELIRSIAEGIVAFILGTVYIPVAMLLVVITILEYLLERIYSTTTIVLISLIPLVFIGNDLLNGEMIVLYSVLILFFITYSKNQSQLNKIEIENENKRKLIYKLQDKLKEEQDFKEQFLYTAQLEERNKISGKLHDKIGHTISGTLLQLEAIKLTIDNNKEQGKQLLDIAIKNLRVGMNDIRMTLRDIRPQQEELGINRIKLILDEKTSGTKYKYKVNYNGDLEKITTSTWIMFVQAIKELSTNSIKYSKGNIIEANILVLNKMIKFEVKDDGIGSNNVVKGIGLSNLEEKVAKVDGKLIIDGSKGFSVIILIPFN